ncbi:unannotated protein [freshwater metagenome]|uniref:Unannotated protein n=1 Tax=freshwater metagenome TaxID=449393 RepID=A0A6J7CZ88_9ZZZZ|nr:MlrC family protein 3 [Actinomycetota bacterium]
MTPTGRRVRVGVTGYAHEVNALADPITLGHGLEASQLEGGLAASWEAGALLTRLHELGDVEIVELPMWEFGASGPLDGDDFRTVVAQVVAAIRVAGSLDGVVVLGHGAGSSTDDRDTDGTFLNAVRSVIGAEVPLVVVLDFHANMSAAMADACDVIVGYRTNPHVDIQDRLVEAAEHMHRMLDGERTCIAWCSLPMLLPQIAQLTAPDEPLGQVVHRGQVLAVGPIRNVSVFGGFSLGDTEHCGTSVVVTALRGDEPAAARVVGELCTQLWTLRGRYRMHATPLVSAVVEAGRASRGERTPVIMADVADNPGGGAPGNSTFVLDALLSAGVDGVVMGLHCDPDVVTEAFEAGIDGTIDIEFNHGSTRPLARPLRCRARVTALVQTVLVPTRGVYAGSTRHPGRSCALDLGGIAIGVSSHPVQCADDDTLRHVGLHPETARVVVVKSRGHFRAGFDHLFSPDQIIEVSAPGVATVELDTIAWQHLPRPAWPLDPIEQWEPTVIVHRGGTR